MVETDTAIAATGSGRRSSRMWRRFTVASRRANLYLLLEIIALVVFLLMVGTTYLTFTNAPPDRQLLPAGQVALLMVGTLLPAMSLMVLFGRRMAIRRAGGSTGRLHVKLVFFFSIVAAVPTLLVAGFAAVLFQSGVNFWFSDNSRQLMQNANALAQGYYEQNQRQVANQTITMAADIRYYLERGTLADPDFADFYGLQVQGRELNESAILQQLPNGEVRTAAIVDLGDEEAPQRLLRDLLTRAGAGEQVAVQADPTRIAALVPIDPASGVFLYNARNSEALAFSQWERAQAVVANYSLVTDRARALQLRFNLALFFVSLMLLALAVWFALRFADRQVEPLRDLVAAARKVGGGNFALRLEGRTGADEIGLLNRAFNRMTAQLEKQTDALVGANRQLAERRTFIEAVLQSVTAGVISIDHDGQILLMNASARKLLLNDAVTPPATLLLDNLAPQMVALTMAGLSSGVVSYNRAGELLTLAVKVAPATNGHVITFEDITRQLLDQRQAAWSDVARRIAHEIKNPLTPIQLATERLKRRYRKQIVDDGELFEELTATIIRQVGDLRKMVDEFSSFARLPKPSFRQEDALDLIRQAVFLQEVAHPAVNYVLDADVEQTHAIACDRHQFGQAMTNVLKNAVEAIEARESAADVEYRGRIKIVAEMEDDRLCVSVEDNGIGLPQDRERIVEPYMTTREKGTGLGLAIVNKIVEEHGGEMTFAASEGGGTRVTMRFARNPVPTDNIATGSNEAAE